MRTLLLVGAGHAHLHLLRHSAVLRAAGYDVHLLAPAETHYSGVASACATGSRPPARGRVDLRAVVADRPVTHHVGLLQAVDVAGRRAVTDRGAVLGWDTLALAVGSEVDLPGVDVAPGVLRIKPLVDLHRLRELAPGSRVTVVGAGASGLELAGHLSVHGHRVSVLEAGAVVGAGLPAGARRWVLRLLHRRGVRLHPGATVHTAREDGCRWQGGGLAHDAAVLATGLVAPALVPRLGLGTRAGVPVRATLQHRDHDTLFATGDCADFLPRPLARVGVHGVRQGPVLLAALVALARGGQLPTYHPPERVLQILDLGGGQGLATRGDRWLPGRVALLAKNAIDGRWLAAYR